MTHDKKKQSTGSYKGKRDRHEQKEPKGPGKKPSGTKGNYVKEKFRNN